MADASPKRRRGTLTKAPPPSVVAAAANRHSLKKPQSANSLQRTPSAPVYPHGQAASHSTRDFHQRTQSGAYGSSTSSFDQSNNSAPSPKLPVADFGLPSNSPIYHAYSSHPVAPAVASSQLRDELIGAPFDSSGLLSSINSTGANGIPSTGYHRPFPPTLNPSHSMSEVPPQSNRQSQTYGAYHTPGMETTPPRSENGTTSPKRFSGEQRLSKPPGPLRKKSGFSSFVNSMLGSPRTIKISAPENPVHMIHVGYDNETGQFTVGTISTMRAWRLANPPM